MDQLLDKAIADLSERLSVGRSAIEVLCFEQVTWADASL